MSDIKKKLLLIGIIAGLGTSIVSCHNQKKEPTHIDVYYEEFYDDLATKAKNTQEPKATQEPQKEQTTKEPKATEIPEKETVYVNDNAEVREYLDYDGVSFDEVKQAVLNNSNISSYYQYFEYFLNQLEKKVPNVDLTCFYENVKSLNEIEIISKKEMRKRTKTKNTIGYFSPSEHKIVISELHAHVLSHEFIHMLNHLTLNTEDYIVIRSYTQEDSTFNSLQEGISEWLTLYLFSYNEISYAIQVEDVEIIRNILKISEEEFAQNFIQYDYNDIYDRLADYLSFKQIDQLLKLSSREIEPENHSSSIKASQIRKKYDLLLEAMIVSRDGVLNSHEIFEILQLFKKSQQYTANQEYKNDLNLTEGIYNYLTRRTFRTLLQYGMDTNNQINVFWNDEEELDYYDINHLYLAVSETEKGKLQGNFVEEIFDAQGNSFYMGLNNLSVADLSDCQLVLVSDLLENYEDISSITMQELMYLYIDKYYNTEPQKVYR